MDSTHYIYRYIRHDKNCPFYIGQGRHAQRGTGHYTIYSRAYTPKRNNKIWQAIARKTTYSVEILLDNLTKEEANLKEQEFIQLYGQIIHKTGTLCNMTAGGDGCLGSIYTEERRQKVAAGRRGKAHTDKSKKQISTTRKSLNFHWSPQEKKRMSEQAKEYWKTHLHPMKGWKPSIEQRVKMSQDRKGKLSGGKNAMAKKVINTATGDIYASAKEAAELLQVKPTRLTSWLRNDRTNYNKTTYLYLDDYPF